MTGRSKIGEVEGRLLSQLDHPAFPKVLEHSDAGYVREEPDGETLERRAARRPLSASEAVALARELANALSYLHAHFPPIAHGKLAAANIVLGSGDRVWLLEPCGEGTPAGDVARLLETLKSACGAEAREELSRLWSPPAANVPEFLERLRRLKHEPKPLIERAEPMTWAGLLGRVGALVVTLAVAFGVTLKIRFEYLPEWRARRSATAELAAYTRANCGAEKPPAPAIGENILQSSGFDKPCGWHGRPFERGLFQESAGHSGVGFLRLGSDGYVLQEVDLPEGVCQDGCALDLAAWMKMSDTKEWPYVELQLFGPHRSELRTHQLQATTLVPGGWSLFKQRYSAPRGTKKLCVYLDRARVTQGRAAGYVYFDDVSLTLLPAGWN